MRTISIIFIAVVLLLGGYVYWWNQVADIAIEQAEHWKTDRIHEGYEIENSPIEVSGFPYRVKLDVLKMTIKVPADEQNRSLSLRNIWVVAQPWKINHVIFGVNGTVNANWPTQEITKKTTIDATTAQGSAIFNSSGKVETLAIDITELTAKNSWRPTVSADRLQIHSRLADLSQAETTGTTLPTHQYSIQLDTLDLGEDENNPIGKEIERFDISVILQGKPKDFRNQKTIEAWRDKGGILDIQEMNLVWGESKTSAKGTLSLDKKNYPIGAFTSQITGFNQILDALVKSRKIDQKAARTVTFALNLLAKENQEGERYLDIPLTLQDGALYLGPLQLMKVNPVFE